ncbi:hypothetical protein CEXT_382241 [Caerostris extrusa]|uniref:Uncharacterized protein n=1 Tax=Caerostris extrusa TaxID=172846 RepID=A0AAV4N8S9_CAEEX|nr:hypothetical protein CEXT_382241 [Caerostris extrusa]
MGAGGPGGSEIPLRPQKTKAVLQLVKDKSLSFLNERLIGVSGGPHERWGDVSIFTGPAKTHRFSPGLLRFVWLQPNLFPCTEEGYRRSITSKNCAPIFWLQLQTEKRARPRWCLAGATTGQGKSGWVSRLS